jgi:transposase
MGRAVACPCPDPFYCDRADRLLGLPGLHVVEVLEHDPGLLVVVESAAGACACPGCGVVASSRGRREVRLVDAPCFGRPVELRWRKRIRACAEPACPVGAFVEQDEAISRPRALLTTRACWWAVAQIRREHASIAGLARRLGTTWNTVWNAICPLLEAMAADPARFAGVDALGVDEHVWHHVSTKPVDAGGRGPKELTGIVDLTRDAHGRVRARLLDLVPGRSGKAYADWLSEREAAFRDGVQVATLDPFHGYKTAIDDELEDATAVLDAFHVVKLGTQAMDEVRRRVQNEIHGHRGRNGDPLYGIRNILRAGREKLTERQKTRLGNAFAADDRHVEVEVAWLAAQKLREAYAHANLAAGKKIAETVVADFISCPIPEIARLGRTLRKWKNSFLAYFDTDRARGIVKTCG